MILSDFSYKMVEYDNIFDLFSAEFADNGKKQYLCRNKKWQEGGVCLSELLLVRNFITKRMFDYESLSREYYFYPFG